MFGGIDSRYNADDRNHQGQDQPLNLDAVSFTKHDQSVMEIHRDRHVAQRLEAILDGHSYVSVHTEFPDEQGFPDKHGHLTSCVVHIKRLNGAGYVVHVSHIEEQSSARMSVLDQTTHLLRGESGEYVRSGSPELERLVEAVEKRVAFEQSRPHVLLVHLRGMHKIHLQDWIPEQGGAERYVTDISKTLADMGFRVTVAARGGIKHPETGEMLPDKEVDGQNRRTIYLTDGHDAFLNKYAPESYSFLPILADDLVRRFGEQSVALVISNFFDGLTVTQDAFDKGLDPRIPHVHIPHDTGRMKERALGPAAAAEKRIDLRIEKETITYERLADHINRNYGIMEKGAAMVKTSDEVESSLMLDYRLNSGLELRPCVDLNVWSPRSITRDHAIWDELARHSSLDADTIYNSKRIVEFSRTISTKNKGDLIRSFSEVLRHHPDAVLIMNISSKFENGLADKLHALLEDPALGLRGRYVVFEEPIDAVVQDAYQVAHIYAITSLMEGFGISPLQAAALGKPVVSFGRNSSNRAWLVPFVGQYLMDPHTHHDPALEAKKYLIGRGAITVATHEVVPFGAAISRLLSDEALYRDLAEGAFAVAQDFSWEANTRKLLRDMELKGLAPLQMPSNW